jgi:uncharacterized membrane protein
MVTSVVFVAAVVLARVVERPSRDVLALGWSSTVLDVIATALFMLATREGLLTVVAVITGLYPAATVLLARWFLGEHLQLVQRVGLGLAATSVTVLAVAS